MGGACGSLSSAGAQGRESPRHLGGLFQPQSPYSGVHTQELGDAVTPHCPHPTSQPGNSHLLLSIDSPVLDISHERSQPAGELVCLAPFISTMFSGPAMQQLNLDQEAPVLSAE